MMHTILYPVNELKIGGAEQQLLELVRGLDKTRFQPLVAPIYPGGALDAEFRAIPGVEVIDLHRRGKFDPAPLWRIGTILRRRKVDIVQPFLSPATFFGLLPALLVRTPVMLVTERCGVRRTRGLGYKLYRSVEDHLSHRADAIIPNSEAGRTMLLDRGLPDDKIKVIYNGINRNRLSVDSERVRSIHEQLNLPADGFVVGILASLTPAKGHHTLLRAIAAISAEHPEVRLAVVGDGALRAELGEAAAEQGIADRVVFFGYQRNVADFIATFDVLVSASHDNEGCSNSILEAMALGVPIIATDTGGNRELVRDRETGFLVPARDDAALTRALIHVITSRQDAKDCAASAKHMTDTRFSLERMVLEYEEIYFHHLEVSRRAHERAPHLEHTSTSERDHA
jgi:L-malate glycosyltransferase